MVTPEFIRTTILAMFDHQEIVRQRDVFALLSRYPNIHDKVRGQLNTLKKAGKIALVGNGEKGYKKV